MTFRRPRDLLISRNVASNLGETKQSQICTKYLNVFNRHGLTDPNLKLCCNFLIDKQQMHGAMLELHWG